MKNPHKGKKMRKNIWQCLCGELLAEKFNTCPICKKKKEEVFKTRQKKIEEAKKRFLGTTRLVLLFEKEILTQSEISREMLRWGYPQEETQEFQNRLVKIGYLKDLKGRFSLTPAAESFILEWVVEQEKIDL
jgi:hypothetical protein